MQIQQKIKNKKMTNKKNRNFVSNNLKIDSWQKIEPYFTKLNESNIDDKKSLEKWLSKRSELDAVLEEDLAWRYIKMNCDTTKKELADSFKFFISEIEPKASEWSNKLDIKFLQSSPEKFLTEKKHEILIRTIKKKHEIFRKNNIPIIAKLQEEEQEYGVIASNMTIKYNDEEMTLQKASNFLKNTDRNVRQEVYELMNNRRFEDADKLNHLLSKLIEKRQEIAKNADFPDYISYKFADLGRFDYTIEDCLNFHNSIAKEVVPIINILQKKRKETLKYDELRPFDLDVDINLKPQLKPFADSNELIEKTISCFSEIDVKFGEFIKIMKEKKYLDLDARKGKAPGGFNYPLYESNVPFIFMNATGNIRDLETMVHEGGHAIHSFLSKNLELVDYKSLPSEVAELASMSMELISMEFWHHFFDSPEELKRAKRIQLEGVISVLPWVATIDKFQFWLYQNPNHSFEEREESWLEIFKEYSGTIVNYEGYENFQSFLWQKQLHIFEVPFYYIEYAISQLGAIAIWRNFKNNPQQAIEKYQDALKLGYTKTIPEIYETAGIKFDFSAEYVKEIMEFVQKELDNLD